jgi:two-component system, LytTR family, sensor kinase
LVHLFDLNNRTKIYWLAQIGGWGLLVIGNIINATIQEQLGAFTVFASIAIFILGVSLTHFYRWLIHRLLWKRLSIPALIPRILISSIALSGLFTFFNNVFEDIAAGRWPFAQELHSFISGKAIELYFILDIFNFAWLFFIWNILYFTVHTFENWKKEEINNLKLQASQREIELKSFRAQMNPHFVFNSLNGIRALIDEDPSKAKHAITLLSGILRSNMAANRPGSGTLRSELELVEKYLALEKIRFEDRLHVDMQINPALLDVDFPVFVLQTLVENAIKHGISQRVKGGVIAIRIFESGQMICVTVSNDGVYAPNENVGIGIENSMKRLQLVYGPKAQFHISQDDHQVVVRIQIPQSTIKT